MSGRQKLKSYLGHRITKRDNAAMTGLVGMSLFRFGIPKKKVKNEARLWAGIKAIYGLVPFAGETFMESAYRIRHQISQMGKEERDQCALKVNRAEFHAMMDALLTGADKQRLDDLKTPVTLHPSRKGPKPTVDAKEAFYKSWEWRTLRLKALQEHGRVCKCCGNRPGMFYASGEPVRIVIDHIKPISKYWHLRLDPSNLQPLCDECNQGKGNWDETDFRSPEAPDEWVESPQEDIVLSVLNQLNEGSTRQ